LNGAGCAAALPTASADADNNVTNAVALMDASLLKWIFVACHASDLSRNQNSTRAPMPEGGVLMSRNSDRHRVPRKFRAA
jgi:hypothetical protein